jgi:hypothetical protein
VILLLLSLPPEIGRLDLRDANLLLAFLLVQLIAVTYLSSAIASTEIGVEGEKALPDLALSPFAPRAIAAGKLASSAIYAASLLAAALPLVVLSGALRGSPLWPVIWAEALTLAVATAAGTWGAWLGGRLTSDFSRSLAHWAGLALVFGATAWLPDPWSAASPLRMIDALVRSGWSAAFITCTIVYAGLAALGALMVRLQAQALQGHETETHGTA